jgi:hypothetical protein
VLNADLRIRIGNRCTLGIDLLNVLNRTYDDIAYYFATRISDPPTRRHAGVRGATRFRDASR